MFHVSTRCFWSCDNWSKLFGTWNQLRAANRSRCSESLPSGCQSRRSKMLSLLPTSCMGRNSGVSRKRPDLIPFTTMKFPQLVAPTPKEALPFQVPKEPQPDSTLPNAFVAPSPDLVVALTTRLDLSPYCASGEPVINSID